MAKLYVHIMPGLVLVAPIVIIALGVVVSMHLSWGRWIIHLLVFAALVCAPLAAFRIEWWADPTTILYPGPGEGFLVILYLVLMIPLALGYAVFALVSFFARRRTSQGTTTRSSPASF